MLTKRTVAQREADLALIASKLLAGWTYRQITEHIVSIRPYKISVSQVSLDVKDIRAAWAEDQKASRSELIAQEMEFLRQIQAEAVEGYKRSLTDVVKTTDIFKTKRPKRTGRQTAGKASRAIRDAERMSRTTETRDGNPAFLLVALKCSEARRGLLGLDPVKEATPPPPPPEGGEEGETGVILLPQSVEEEQPPEVVE